MRTIGENSLGTLFLERTGRLTQSAGSIDHVIDDDAGLARDITDDIHHLGDISLWTTFINNRQIRFIELLGYCPGTHNTTNVRRHDDHVRILLLPDVTHQDRRCIDVIHRAFKETLDLIRMQIDR